MSEPKAGLPLWRDPWAWACLLAVAPLLIHSWGALLGEPFSDDYDFLHRALLERGSTWFDAGGSSVFWRPLSRQAYYALFGPLMLTQPRLLAFIHAGLLALAAVLIYRAFRLHWGSPLAALAGTFPLFSEGTRTLLLWPSAFQDLGALLFSALAIHEAANRRRGRALLSMLAGLLCKEIALVAALLVPWMPNTEGSTRRWRWRFALGAAGVVVAWGVVYLLVRQSGGALFYRDYPGDRMSPAPRLLWAFGHGGIDALNLDLRHPILALSIVAMVVALILAANWIPRRRGVRATPWAWIVWGLTWFSLATAMLSETFPSWGSFRSVVGLAGLGIAIAGALSGLGIWGVALLTALRLTTFFMAPGPPQIIAPSPPSEGVTGDFDSLARIQRYIAGLRRALTERFPRLPPGSAVGTHHRPNMVAHGMVAGRSLQVWYRDSTLRWYDWEEIAANPRRPMMAVLEYEPYQKRQVVVIDGQAVFEYLDAIRIMSEGRFDAALAALQRADSLQQDRGAAVFLGVVAGRMAVCRLGLNDAIGAREEAIRSIALWPHGTEGRFALAILLATGNDPAGALAQLDTLLTNAPSDEGALALRDSLRRQAANPWRP